jgi:hypothetical protein
VSPVGSREGEPISQFHAPRKALGSRGGSKLGWRDREEGKLRFRAEGFPMGKSHLYTCLAP